MRKISVNGVSWWVSMVAQVSSTIDIELSFSKWLIGLAGEKVATCQ